MYTILVTATSIMSSPISGASFVFSNYGKRILCLSDYITHVVIFQKHPEDNPISEITFEHKDKLTKYPINWDGQSGSVEFEGILNATTMGIMKEISTNYIIYVREIYTHLEDRPQVLEDFPVAIYPFKGSIDIPFNSIGIKNVESVKIELNGIKITNLTNNAMKIYKKHIDPNYLILTTGRCFDPEKMKEFNLLPELKIDIVKIYK